MSRRRLGVGEAQTVVDAVRKKFPERAISFRSFGPVVSDLVVAAFDRKAVGAREIGGKIERFFGFVLSLGVIAQPCPSGS